MSKEESPNFGRFPVNRESLGRFLNTLIMIVSFD